MPGNLYSDFSPAVQVDHSPHLCNTTGPTFCLRRDVFRPLGSPCLLHACLPARLKCRHQVQMWVWSPGRNSPQNTPGQSLAARTPLPLQWRPAPATSQVSTFSRSSFHCGPRASVHYLVDSLPGMSLPQEPGFIFRSCTNRLLRRTSGK